MSKLANCLLQSALHEQKVQICRQILAQNMNFSPAWLVILLQKQKDAQRNQLTINQFYTLFQIAQLNAVSDDVALMFDYFDYQKRGRISHKDFINSLLPSLKNGLRRAVMKRLAENLQVTLDLKYALKRFCIQVIRTQTILASYDRTFNDLDLKDNGTTKQLNKQQLKQFLRMYGKFPSDSELVLIERMLCDGKIKAISKKFVQKTISQNLKKNDIQIMMESEKNIINGLQELKRQQQITENIRRSRLQSKQDIKPINSQFSKAKNIASKLLNSDLQDTPFAKIRTPTSSRIVYQPKTGRKNSLSLLADVNCQLKDQLNMYRKQNEQRLNYLHRQLGILQGK